MNNSLFRKLAADNIKRNSKSYVPYIVTCIVTIAIFYIVQSLSLNPGLEKMTGADTINALMQYAGIFAGIFSLVFLLYSNSFLIRRRKKEFAVFNVLGMEKSHLARTLAWETQYIFGISITAGLILGIALDKVMFLLILKIIGGTVTLGFFVSVQAIVITIVLFAVIFLTIYACSACRMYHFDPVELMRESNAGEKEPEANWLLSFLGVAFTGGGYLISILMDKPLSKAIPYLFAAVMLVVIGTYMLFTASSIALLKALKRRKDYYYDPRHFISVSNLIYRMKQNAFGLANICILSTTALVMASSTSSLMFGMDDSLQRQYPNDFDIYCNEEDLAQREECLGDIRRLQQEQKLNITSETYYNYLIIPFIVEKDRFTPIPFDAVTGEGNEVNFIFVSLDDYNASMGTSYKLNANEVMLCSGRNVLDNPVLPIFDKEYRVKERSGQPIGNGIVAKSEAYSCMVIVPDAQELNRLYMLQRSEFGDRALHICCFCGFDSDAGEPEQESFYQLLMDRLPEKGYELVIASRADAKADQISTYGGFFFIGIFLGTLFLMAAVLIIYYKQISEGYDDRERFAIMQKIGMSRQEVRVSIRSQVQTVFFLPLVIAGIHMAAALPMTARILLRLNLDHTGLYLICSAVSFLVFAAIYIVVYHLTAKTYYRIINPYHAGGPQGSRHFLAVDR